MLPNNKVQKNQKIQKMWDFTLPWVVLIGLVMCLWTKLPTASRPKSARVYCGCRPGPTRVTPPSRQDDGNVRAPALSRAGCVVVQVVAVGRVRWRLFYRQLGVFCPHPSSTDSLWRGCRVTSQTPPVSSRCCTAVVAVALEAGSALRGDSSY